MALPPMDRVEYEAALEVLARADEAQAAGAEIPQELADNYALLRAYVEGYEATHPDEKRA